MTEHTDNFPYLPITIDVGGDLYYLGPQKPVELAYKSRADFTNTFGKELDTERLLRTYLYLTLKAQHNFSSVPKDDKVKLIKILKRRASQLQASSEFSSSLLKNMSFQRTYVNIQKLIQELEGAEYKEPTSKWSLPEFALPCKKAKRHIKQIPEEKLFQTMLEISWYLLHPDAVPKEIQCEWALLIQKLDRLRLGDLMSLIKQTEGEKGLTAPEKPTNYFKKMNLVSVAKAESVQNALDQAKRLALDIQGENAKNDMEERLKTLVNLLEVRKYLNDSFPRNSDGLPIVNKTGAEKIGKQLMSNPMRGGAATLDKPLGVAMSPMFEYFRASFDPIYTFLEAGAKRFGADPKMVMLPQLLTLLHICNNLNPYVTNEGGANTFGVYRITNVSEELLYFVNKHLNNTESYISALQDDKQKRNFNLQLFNLPKVRLTSLLHKYSDSAAYRDPETIPYIQFFTVGNNLIMPVRDEFIASGKTDEEYDALIQYFNEKDLYILCTKSEDFQTIPTNVPMNLYTVDFNGVDVGETGLKITIPETPFPNHNENKLDKLVTLKEYVVYNDVELALCIFIVFKELMPK